MNASFWLGCAVGFGVASLCFVCYAIYAVRYTMRLRADEALAAQQQAYWDTILRQAHSLASEQKAVDATPPQYPGPRHAA